MRKLTIDRNIWLRGEGSFSSSLLRSLDQKQCCVGIYLEQCGVDRDRLHGIKAVNSMSLSPLLPEETKWLYDKDEAEDLYCKNDNLTYTAKYREKQVAEAFAKHDVEVEFIN